MKLLNDYDMTIQYHQDKASVVEDGLSQKTLSIGDLDDLRVSR